MLDRVAGGPVPIEAFAMTVKAYVWPHSKPDKTADVDEPSGVVTAVRATAR